jgi:predicted amino acid racemase
MFLSKGKERKMWINLVKDEKNAKILANLIKSSKYVFSYSNLQLSKSSFISRRVSQVGITAEKR